MTDLVEQAREIGGEVLAKEVEKLENRLEAAETHQTLNQRLREYIDYKDTVLNSMDAEDKKALLEEFESETTNAEIPVAGRINSESTTVEVENGNPDTCTKEVEIPAPGQRGDSDTMTVEYEDHGTSLETINEFHGWLNQARSETTRREQERANQRQESQLGGAIPDYGYVNADEINGEDIDDSDIPVPGQRNREGEE